ncbi:hypothetical protein CROQUDRAFT_87480 [Cronartium quercuum f. sp. fusiforme G11]|uniref:Uncharacterized protein n=1 Tax=Cronartium quercuum f. sp. fusiforme G11 TaxID=708437 RepID=A0A9P6NVD9_9BASI|nr:hypothetical protein CROQUDRAFT_87480 [Cronartium quercuum f. sp. fusiforme G11]
MLQRAPPGSPGPSSAVKTQLRLGSDHDDSWAQTFPFSTETETFSLIHSKAPGLNSHLHSYLIIHLGGAQCFRLQPPGGDQIDQLVLYRVPEDRSCFFAKPGTCFPSSHHVTNMRCPETTEVRSEMCAWRDRTGTYSACISETLYSLGWHLLESRGNALCDQLALFQLSTHSFLRATEDLIPPHTCYRLALHSPIF